MSTSCRLIERLSRRTGVPVFIRPAVMPSFVILSVSPFAAGSATRPPSICTLPMCISPLRNVPAVMMTHFVLNSAPSCVFTPVTFSFSTKSSVAMSCHMSRFGMFSSISRQYWLNFVLSHCARGLHIAGPFERLSMRNWIDDLSVTMPVYPPSASISLTICPFAMPPIAGLQLIWAILFMSIVIKHVFLPKLAAAAAASQPACPAPITSMSYSNVTVSFFVCAHVSVHNFSATKIIQLVGKRKSSGDISW